MGHTTTFLPKRGVIQLKKKKTSLGVRGLSAEAESLNQCPVPADVLFVDISKQPPTLAHQLE